jgi:dCTP diphosphatase
VDLDSVRNKLREFAHERDWEQFHHPKNLAMALGAEAGELLEIFQWLSEAESRHLASSPDRREAAAEEIADIVIYAIRLADVLDIDLEEAISRKIAANRLRYPIAASRGRADKRP